MGYPGASPELAICCLGGDTHLGTFPMPSSSSTVHTMSSHHLLTGPMSTQQAPGHPSQPH